MTVEEQARIAAEAARGLFNKERLKVLLPTAGGPNALMAGRIASSLVRGEAATLTTLYVEAAAGSLLGRLWRRVRPDERGKNLQQHLDMLKSFADERGARFEARRVTEADTVGFICREAAHGFDLLLLGSGRKSPLRSSVTSALLERAPCHVGIVCARGPVLDCRRILVATNGSFFSRAAVELAVLYAEQVQATVTVLYSMEADADLDGDGASVIDEGFRRMMATTLLTTLSPLLRRTTAKVSVMVRESDQPTPPVIAEARTGLYELLVVGAEASVVQHQLSVGYDVERIVKEAPCTAVVVVPRIAGASGGASA
jgi:hypothetical protein